LTGAINKIVDVVEKSFRNTKSIIELIGRKLEPEKKKRVGTTILKTSNKYIDSVPGLPIDSIRS